MIPEAFIEELLARSDIESIISDYTRLTRKGNRLTGLCPFHSEKTGSFVVYLENQSYYCFGCGAGGGLINFIMCAENLTYLEALRYLAQKVGMAFPEDKVDDKTYRMKTRILEMNRAAAHYYHDCLTSSIGKDAYQYLIERGRTPKIIRRFGLGYAPSGADSVVGFLKNKGFSYEEMVAGGIAQKSQSGNGFYDRFYQRVIFPIIDLRGNVIAFGGRTLVKDSKGPKYLNTSDTLVFKKSRNLYALNFAKTSKAPYFILAEGYMDVIAVHQAGFDNAIATLGTALTEEQARLMSQYTDRVIIAYDADGAGQTATKRAINIFDQAGIKVSIIGMTGAKDPDEFIQKYGAQRFQMLLEGSSNAIEFEIAKLRGKYDLALPDGKVGFLKEFSKLMAGIRSPIEKEVYISKVSQELQINGAAIHAQVDTIAKAQKRSAKKKQRGDTNIYIGSMAAAKDDAQRKQNLKYAMAEEGIIRCLIQNPDFYSRLDGKLDAADFVTTHNQRVYQTLSTRIQNNQKINIEFLTQDLPPDDIARLSAIMASAVGKRSDWGELESFIKTLKEFRLEKSSKEVAEMGNDQLKDYINSLAAKKK